MIGSRWLRQCRRCRKEAQGVYCKRCRTIVNLHARVERLEAHIVRDKFALAAARQKLRDLERAYPSFEHGTLGIHYV